MTKRKNAGFTLIELVIVIVILGVLAAVAAPRFLDLSQEATTSAINAQASALQSGAAILFAKEQAGDETVDNPVSDCTDVSNAVDNFADNRFSIVAEGDGDGDGDFNSDGAGVFTFLPTGGGDAVTCQVIESD